MNPVAIDLSDIVHSDETGPQYYVRGNKHDKEETMAHCQLPLASVLFCKFSFSHKAWKNIDILENKSASSPVQNTSEDQEAAMQIIQSCEGHLRDSC